MHMVDGGGVLLKPTEALQDFLDTRAGFQAQDGSEFDAGIGAERDHTD